MVLSRSLALPSAPEDDRVSHWILRPVGQWMCPSKPVWAMCAKAQHVTHWCQEYCPRWAGWESRTKLVTAKKMCSVSWALHTWLRLLPALPVKLLEQCQSHRRHLKQRRLSLGDNLREKPLYKISYSVHSHLCKPSCHWHYLSLALPSLPPSLFNPLPAALVSDKWLRGLTLMDYPTCMHLWRRLASGWDG